MQKNSSKTILGLHFLVFIWGFTSILGALITFLITISDFNLFNIGAPFWGLIAGFFITKLVEK